MREHVHGLTEYACSSGPNAVSKFLHDTIVDVGVRFRAEGCMIALANAKGITF